LVGVTVDSLGSRGRKLQKVERRVLYLYSGCVYFCCTLERSQSGPILVIKEEKVNPLLFSSANDLENSISGN